MLSTLSIKYWESPSATVVELDVPFLLCKEGVSAERISGTTLRRRMYSHLLSARKTWAVTFPSDFVNANREFFNRLFVAYKIQIFVLDSLAGDNQSFVDVTCDDSELGIDFIEDNIEMPEITMKFIQVNPL